MALVEPLEAHFVTSATSLANSPAPVMAEVAFLGRSNVGKSSLINALVRRKQLAKSSATPGKTRLINYFESRWRHEGGEFGIMLVDLPGFGYAKVSKAEQAAWSQNLNAFITQRGALKLYILLRDSRHPDLPQDEEVNAFLEAHLKGDQRLLEVFTKADKLNRKERDALLRSRPEALVVSSLEEGTMQRLREAIYHTLEAEG